VESLLKVDNLYDPMQIETLHHVNQALYAHVLKHRDIDYVVKDGQVLIVDEFTGRLMPGRRWGDGLHQAVEAKEKVRIENENQTLATITFQNYFRMYEKLSGMTGTADTEAAEFRSTYNLDVVVIPTNLPMVRTDYPDVVYRTEKEKFKAVVEEIKELYEKGKPVLVGTISIENSERLSKLLAKHGVPHHVLNAKHHEREAEIVAQAGRLKAGTLSTNMAGRGTDIVLGGNPAFMAATKAGKDDATELYRHALDAANALCEEEKKKVIGLGGLHILGTERHESRRIDNQLRGRSGRQGDPGSSRFYVSLEDDLMRIFGSDRISSIMDKLGMEEDIPIEHRLVSKALESAQGKVDAHNFDIRKHLLEYDDVMNQQRKVVYGYRRQILAQSGLRDMVKDFAFEVAEDTVYTHVEEKSDPRDWDRKSLKEAFFGQFGVTVEEGDFEGVTTTEALAERLGDKVWDAYLEKSRRVGDDVLARVEKVFMLHTLDNLWKDHLLSMDHLKGGIGLRGYAQKNPLNEYKKEGFDLFTGMIFSLKTDVVERLFKVHIEADKLSFLEPGHRRQPMVLGRGEAGGIAPGAAGAARDVDAGADGGVGGVGGGGGGKPRTVRRATKKVGRNEPCPCGSGKKYKKCCGM
jgi:preprotein translocase subunit SecA